MVNSSANAVLNFIELHPQVFSLHRLQGLSSNRGRYETKNFFNSRFDLRRPFCDRFFPLPPGAAIRAAGPDGAEFL